MLIIIMIFMLSFYIVMGELEQKVPEEFDYELQASREESNENKLYQEKNHADPIGLVQENGNMKSTIETSVCKYQGSRTTEEAEYINTLINYPYAASIQRKGSHYASGALVDKRWVLSVAAEFYKCTMVNLQRSIDDPIDLGTPCTHIEKLCTENYVSTSTSFRESIKLFRVRLGSVDCKRGGAVFPLKAIRIHPSFAQGLPSFDLALLRLASVAAENVAFSPIAMSEEQGRVVSAKFQTTYWPRIIVNGSALSRSAKERVKFTKMRVSKQALIPSAVCRGMVQGLDRSNLCLQPVVTHHTACIPDAGAPVVANDGLWGITSGWVTPDCLSKPGPTLFTRVSAPSVSSWISAQLLH